MLVLLFNIFLYTIHAKAYCPLYPLESYNSNAETHDYLLYNDNENLEELANILKLKNESKYSEMFIANKELSQQVNHPAVYYNLGQFYRQGIGTNKNIDFAIENYYFAAIRGSTKASVNLAFILDDVIINDKDTLTTLMLPLSLDYSIYWLATAVSLNEEQKIEKALKDLLELRFNQSLEYKELFFKKYPYFFEENGFDEAYKKILYTKRNFSQIYSKKTYLDNVIEDLNKNECLLKKIRHWIRFSQWDLIESQLYKLNTYLLDLNTSFRRIRNNIKNKKKHYELKQFFKQWSPKEALNNLTIN